MVQEKTGNWKTRKEVRKLNVDVNNLQAMIYYLKEDLVITKRRMAWSEGTVNALLLRNKRAERNLEALEKV